MADDETPRLRKGLTLRISMPGVSARGALPSDLDTVLSEDIDATALPAGGDEDLTGEIFGERYKLESHLADGGMGSVYVGRHIHLDMPIAVKVMLPAMAALPGYVRRFRREARVMSTLKHRNVVRVLDFGIENTRPYIVMELLEGQSIARWLDFAEELPSLVEVDELMRQVFDGLHVAHEAGIVHRDLKPDNIFLALEGDGIYLIKLLDFGLAHLDDPSDAGPALTQSGMVSGTPEYMSPEQCHSLGVGASSDIYALGCIVTELLQGVPPFSGKTSMDVMTKQMFQAPGALDRPAGAEPIPPLLERLRLDMLAKDPAQRPASVAALRARWEEALRSEANATRFPARKQQTGGARQARVPDWTAPEPKPEPSARAAQVMRVGLVRLHTGAAPFGDAGVVGLASGGVILSEIDPAAPIPDDVDGVVIDAGHDVDGACAWMADYDHRRRPRPLVCVDASSDQLGRLISAGAGDLVNYPVDVPAVLRKLLKLHRRFSRG